MSSFLLAVLCLVTNWWGFRGLRHQPVSGASVEAAVQVRPETNSKFAPGQGSCFIVLWGWRRKGSRLKASRISNICPTLVCPSGPLSPQPMRSSQSAHWYSELCLPLLCYWVRLTCCWFWCVERPLTDRLAWPSCHSQVSQTCTVCQTVITKTVTDVLLSLHHSSVIAGAVYSSWTFLQCISRFKHRLPSFKDCIWVVCQKWQTK